LQASGVAGMYEEVVRPEIGVPSRVRVYEAMPESASAALQENEPVLTILLALAGVREEKTGGTVSMKNELSVVVAESLPKASRTEKAQLEYVPSKSTLKAMVLAPEETLVLEGVQEPEVRRVPASEEEKEKEGLLLLEGV